MTRIFFKYVKPYAFMAIIGPLLMIIEVGAELFMPKLMKKIIDVGVANMDSAYILRTGAVMAAVALIGIIGGIGGLVASANVSQRAGADIRRDTFAKIQSFSFKNIDRYKASSLITRLTNDVTQVQLVIMTLLRMLIRSPFLAAGGVIMALSINAELTLILAIMIPIVAVSVFLILKKAFPMFNEVQAKLDRVNGVMRENLAGVRVIKAFVRSEYEKERFAQVNADYKNVTISAFGAMIIAMPLMMIIMNGAIIAVLWFGGIKFASGEILIGDIMAFITYITQILMSLMMLAMSFMMVSRAKVSGDRINEVLVTEVDILNPTNPKTPEKKGEVEYRNVCFKYSGEKGDYVLEDISFKAEKGQTIAIIGATGSGKSSIVNLMPRLYDATKGEVLIDGVNVKDFDLEELRSRVSVVLQENILFSGSVKENIKWGKENADDEEVFAAAKAAQAHDFITAKPEGYETALGQKGVNVSGGQKQRIAIARAIIKNPEIIIFDDSTSAVDTATERKIQNAMNEQMKDATKFIIAQRISSVTNADKILVISGGKIAAQGTHSELMKTSEEYREIYNSQVKRGEKE